MDAIPGRITGRVKQANRKGDHPVMMLQVVVSSPRDVRLVELMTQHGQKSSPPNGSKTAIISIGSSWRVAVAVDDGVSPDVEPGESRYYSTGPNGGERLADIHLKNDGTIEIESPVEVSVSAPIVNISAPVINIAGTINLTGDLIATGTITADDLVEV